MGCGPYWLIEIGQSGSGEDDATASGTAGTGADGPGWTATSVADGTTSPDGSDSTGPINCIDSPQLCTVELSLRRAVDILFVVDNSGSMGGEQGTLAQSFGSFINVLEAQEVGANYRIGVTTSEGSGNIRATSCRSRLFEFLFEWEFGTIDEQQRGCLDSCAFETIDVAEPWLEKSDGRTNLPPGIDFAQALECVGPQGINGPGYERPLEAMRNALVNNPQGFLRDDALLAVIFVTDEADCSADQNTIGWMQTTGTVFWSTPDRATSGACWNAGVACTGGPGVYDTCFSQDYDMQGQPTNNPDEAVLFPVQRYIDVLTDIAEQKQIDGGQGEVLVALLAGVPVDYPETGVLPYADSVFPNFNEEFGIGPSCNQGAETIQDPPGIPPVRLREFAEAFASEERNIFSVCSADYGVALTQIAAAIGEINERACVGGCVVDADEAADGLQPDCMLVETFADDTPDAPVLPCLVDDNGWDFPAPEVAVCSRALTDPDGSTPTPFDDMSAQCVTVGSNLEQLIERRDGVPVAAGTSVDVSCALVAPVGVTCDEVQ
jgi:hypothetical protein